jgi:hypothetical protein
LSILLCVACSSAEPDAGLARNGGAVPVFSGDLGGNPPSPPSADTPADPNDQSEADETASDPEANEGSPTDGRETPPDPLPLDDGASSDADPPGGDGPGDDPADGTENQIFARSLKEKGNNFNFTKSLFTSLFFCISHYLAEVFRWDAASSLGLPENCSFITKFSQAALIS